MSFLRYIVRNNIGSYLLTLVLFVGSWHVFSTASYISSQKNYLAQNLRANGDRIENFVIRKNLASAYSTLGVYITDTLDTIIFTSEANDAFYLKDLIIGKSPDGSFFTATETLDIHHNGLHLGSIRIFFNTLSVSKKVLFDNAMLYILIAAMFLFLLSIVNYSSYKVYRSIENSILHLEDKLDVANPNSTLSYIESVLMNEAHSSSGREVIKLISKIKTLLSQQHELHDEIKRKEILHELSQKVAHDIRSPLSALQILSQLAPEQMIENKSLLNESVVRINDLAEEMLTQTRGMSPAKNYDPGLLKPNLKKTFEFSEAIEQIIKQKNFENPNAGIHLDIEPGFEKAMLSRQAKGNRSQFQAIISNLINNSIEAQKTDQNDFFLVVAVKSFNNKILIEVSDNGCGMPEHIIKQAPNKGFTHGKQNGNGFGLHYAFTTIQSWNGQISIHSNINIGTKVKIELQTVQSRKGTETEDDKTNSNSNPRFSA